MYEHTVSVATQNYNVQNTLQAIEALHSWRRQMQT